MGSTAGEWSWTAAEEVWFGSFVNFDLTDNENESFSPLPMTGIMFDSTNTNTMTSDTTHCTTENHSDEWESDIVCYGMLLDISLQVKWALDDLQTGTTVIEQCPYARLNIAMEKDHGLVRWLHGPSVGLLSKEVFDALVILGRIDLLHVEAFIPMTEWSLKSKQLEGRGAGTHRRNGLVMSSQLVLSGPRTLGYQLAKNLGLHHLFLQPPLDGFSVWPYQNPQSLHVSLSDSNFTTVAETPDLALRAALAARNVDDFEETTQMAHAADSARLSDLLDNMETLFSQVTQTNAHGGSLPITWAPADQRMLSSLFPHQQEGLDFMINRESGTASGSLNSLWELHSRPGEEDVYQHIITGAKSRAPEDCRGGILADDMGLGKTLTALAAIVASSAQAAAFRTTTNHDHQGNGTITSRSTSQATVVVVPSELLLNTWAREIDQHFYPGSIRWLKYHGQDRRDHDYKLGQYDVVLTTYGTVMAEHRRGHSALHRTSWYRLILDEAHAIRNCSSKQFKALISIQSHIRWCLTGTPIQNSLDDLGSLIRFLGMPLFSEPAIYRKYVTLIRVHQKDGTADFENLRLILSAICLRRSRSILPSSSYTTKICRPSLSAKEREQYRTLEQTCKRAMQIGNKRQGDDAVHHRVMEALLRLRMFCNNGTDPRRALLMSQAGSRPDEVLSFFQQNAEATCAYCSVDILSLGPLAEHDSGYLTPCHHLICGECTEQYTAPGKGGAEFRCSLCHVKHEMDTALAGEELSEISDRKYPSKIMEVVKDVKLHELRDKCLIFSFWKTSLDVLGRALTDCKVKYLRVDGGMPAKKRNTTLLEFQNKSTWRVLLMTFSTGGTGLNGLTVANRIHLLEPQWNPAVEKQAIGRVLRLDQQQKVTVIRYSVEKTIEGIVESRQLRKLQLAGGGFEKMSKEEKQKARADQWQQIQNHLDANQDEAV